ncbi:AbiJ-NTD4 domain-containing protein [Pseudomonas alabamensis]|uniref:AbiJ-NTD4 domain-containing protein n=1 Tax=Pseudomonas alabamensis TaxID=3064349 RepID=UPI003F652694
MTMDFSQRMGLAPARKLAQTDSIDKELQNSLWNVLLVHLFARYVADRGFGNSVKRSNFNDFTESLYSDFLKVTIDARPAFWMEFKREIKKLFFGMSWHRQYSFIEFIVGMNYKGTSRSLAEEFNKVLSRENSAYLFVSGKLAPITSGDEVEEVERAISGVNGYAGVRTHLQTALGLLTDRENPDYRNSIKESISAVESFAKKVVQNDKATLGQALKILEDKHGLHGSLKAAFMTLYGYTSDAGGIRHAILDNTTPPTKADARFMLICCSAFTNFAIDSIEG